MNLARIRERRETAKRMERTIRKGKWQAFDKALEGTMASLREDEARREEYVFQVDWSGIS